jgi:hypothetical protein
LHNLWGGWELISIPWIAILGMEMQVPPIQLDQFQHEPTSLSKQQIPIFTWAQWHTLANL